MNRVTATGLGADERRWAEECIDALDANPEEALNAYCHEGLDVRPGHRVDDDGNDVATGQWVAEICCLEAEGSTREEAVKALAAKLRDDIIRTGAYGC